MNLLIDNYDSFSYNLVQMIGGIDPDIRVVRNDKITVSEIEKLAPDHLILSPGPGFPAQAGILEEAVKHLSGRIPILGVCLGHQGICEAFGGRIVHARRLMHGKQSMIETVEASRPCPLFVGLNRQFLAARYHSLAADPASLPEVLEVTARDCEAGEIMAVQHKKFDVYGLQFHPESILTPEGNVMLENFLRL